MVEIRSIEIRSNDCKEKTFWNHLKFLWLHNIGFDHMNTMIDGKIKIKFQSKN